MADLNLAPDTGEEQPEEEFLAEEVASQISTGISEVDSKMGGGIPKGSLTLIDGESGAGKSVAAQQIVWGALRDELRAVVYTTENTYKSLIANMDSLNLSILDQVLLGRLLIFPAQTTASGWNPTDIFDILLKDIIRNSAVDLVVVDSITSLMLHTQITQAITFFEECKRLCEQGKTIINVVHSYAFDDSSLLRIRSMCDAHLNLRIEEIGDQLINVLEIGKIRGAGKTADNIISFTVEPGAGIRIIPISRTKA